MMSNFKKRKYGFTLIELLIVVAIIAILAAIAIPNFLAAQIRAKVSRTKEDMRSVAIALEAYRVDNNYYPMDIYARVAENDSPVGWDWACDIQDYVPLTTPVAYISSVPQDEFPFQSDPPVPQHEQYFNYQCCQPWFNGDEPYTIYGPDGYYSPDGVRWIWCIWSTGPCLQFFAPGANYYPITQSYDPSNGTVSLGNILRYGP